MQEFLTENTLFATIGILLGNSSGLVLVAEGDDDYLLLKEHQSQELRLIRGTGGREQVLRTAELAQKRGISRAWFLVDSDYDSFGPTPVNQHENVFYSENHDSFMAIVFSDQKTLLRLIDVHLDRVRRKPENAQPVPEPAAVMSETLTLADHLAAVRIIDKRLGLSIDFKKFSFGGLKEAQFSAKSISQVILSRTPEILDRLAEVQCAVEAVRVEVQSRTCSPVGDHDMFGALARVLRRHGVSVRDKDLQRDFILAVSCLSISRTRWFNQIEDWCANMGCTGFTCREEMSLAA